MVVALLHLTAVELLAAPARSLAPARHPPYCCPTSSPDRNLSSSELLPAELRLFDIEMVADSAGWTTRTDGESVEEATRSRTTPAKETIAKSTAETKHSVRYQYVNKTKRSIEVLSVLAFLR
jgi:hypothetical protein